MSKNHSRNNINRTFVDDNGIKWKINRVIEDTAEDIHHIIGQKNKDKYNVNAPVNKIKIKRKKHVALNNFFEWDQDPRSQLIDVFNIVKPVLSIGVKEELYTVLFLTDDSMFYTPEVLKWQKKKQDKNLKK